MHTVDTIAIASTPDVVYHLAADVERWPEILPHYRWVRVLETRGPDECIVEMAARRGRIPVWWRSIMRCDPSEHRIVYKHIGGATAGMDVEWTIVPTSGVTRAHHPRYPLAQAGDWSADRLADVRCVRLLHRQQNAA